jgi:hypothetical protein
MSSELRLVPARSAQTGARPRVASLTLQYFFLVSNFAFVLVTRICYKSLFSTTA